MKISDLVSVRLRAKQAGAYHQFYGGMRSGVLVLDHRDRIVYLNPAAETILQIEAERITGQAAAQALAGHKALLEQLHSKQATASISVQAGGETGYIEMNVTPLPDRAWLVVLHDITGHVQPQQGASQNERPAEQSEETYRYLVENINEIIFTTDLNGVITYVSPVTEELDGPSQDQLLGKSFHALVYPKDRPSVEASLERVLKGEINTFEFRIELRGELHHIRVYLRPILQNDEPTGFLGVASDITERRQVEQALERRASQLAVLNYIGEQIASTIEIQKVLDSATHLIQKHFGYYQIGIFIPDWDREALYMRSSSGAFSDLFPADYHLPFGQGIAGWAGENKSVLLANDVRVEPRYCNPFPNQIMTRSELAVPILIGDELAGVLDLQSPQINAFDENDVRVMKTVANQIAIAMENARLYEEVRRQLSERELQENMLRIHRDLLIRLSSAKNLEEMLRVTVETLTTELNADQVALWLVDWEGNSVRPVIGSPKNHPGPPSPLDRGITGLVARDGRPALITNVEQDDKHGLLPETNSLLCVPLILDRKVIGVISLESKASNAFTHDDLNLLSTLSNSLVVLIERARLFEEVERARMELENRAAELEKANARLLELDRLKSQFLANMSHELRTPLNSIIGFSEILADGLVGSVNSEQAECLKDILDSGRHLLTVINDLLDFSKIDAGRVKLEPASLEISTLFDELQRALAPLVEKKRQHLSFEQIGQLPPIIADPVRVKQVFLNLLSNANKFTPEGGSIVTTCRELEPGTLLFSVSDNGIGIRPEDHALIFEEFRQVDGSLTREVPGTGLGLTISKRIVELHGGRIWVESELHRGSTFYVTLPCTPSTTTTA